MDFVVDNGLKKKTIFKTKKILIHSEKINVVNNGYLVLDQSKTFSYTDLKNVSFLDVFHAVDNTNHSEGFFNL